MEFVGQGRAANESNRRRNLPFSQQNTLRSNAKPPNAPGIPLRAGHSRPHHSLSPLWTTKCLFSSHGFSFNEEGWKSDK